MKPQRKLSDGILPCGRCGVEPTAYRRGYKNIQYFSYECLWCDISTDWKDTVADTIVAWNNLSAKTHPEPGDYLELLEECKPPLLGRPDTPAMWNHLNIMLDLLTDYGDDDD